MKLSIQVVRNDHGDYTAVCPSLPGCLCKGDTREEACDKLDDVIRGYIAAVSNFVPENLTQEVVEV